jgi:hypothetical protein
LEGDDGVYEACKDSFRDDGVFFDELGEVVETGGDGECEEEEA